MRVLHTVNKSPWGSDCLATCLRLIGERDTLLLIEDGVYAARGPADALAALPAGVPVYALRADVEARGLAGQLAQRVALTDEAGFVDLTVRCAKVQSWF